MRLKILLNDNAEEFQFAVHGELKDWREHHTTACSRFGRSTALSQIAFAPLRQLRLHAERYRQGLGLAGFWKRARFLAGLEYLNIFSKMTTFVSCNLYIIYINN